MCIRDSYTRGRIIHTKIRYMMTWKKEAYNEDTGTLETFGFQDARDGISTWMDREIN